MHWHSRNYSKKCGKLNICDYILCNTHITYYYVVYICMPTLVQSSHHIYIPHFTDRETKEHWHQATSLQGQEHQSQEGLWAACSQLCALGDCYTYSNQIAMFSEVIHICLSLSKERHTWEVPVFCFLTSKSNSRRWACFTVVVCQHVGTLLSPDGALQIFCLQNCFH
jgi:hypothetical protein